MFRKISLALAVIPTLSFAQGGLKLPDAAHPVVSFKATIPKATPRGATLLLRIQSVTGSPVLLSAPWFHEGWSVYVSSGEQCGADRIETPAAPTLDKYGRILGPGPAGFSAGVNAPAFIPVNIYCTIKRDDQLTMNIIFYVGVEGRWVQQHFAIETQRVQ